MHSGAHVLFRIGNVYTYDFLNQLTIILTNVSNELCGGLDSDNMVHSGFASFLLLLYCGLSEIFIPRVIGVATLDASLFRSTEEVFSRNVPYGETSLELKVGILERPTQFN